MISLLLGGLSFLWFFLISFKLGLDEVDPVGATGDALDRVDLVLDGVGGPEDPPEVDLLCDGDGAVVTF